MEANTSLMDLLATIKDPRGDRGKRHPLVALLALSVVAMLAGNRQDMHLSLDCTDGVC